MLALLLMLAPLSFAISSQQESVQLTVTEVSDLVKVDGALDFSQLLPGYEYSTSLTVRWNVPASALKNIKTEKVPLYVRITPNSADSWVYFDGGSKKLDFVFACIVRDSACSPESVLSKNIEVYMRAPKNAPYPHSDGITANASLSPFGAESAGKALASPLSGELKEPLPEGNTPPALKDDGSTQPPGAATGFAVLANNPALKNILLALFAVGAIFLIVYFREYLVELVVSPRESKRL